MLSKLSFWTNLVWYSVVLSKAEVNTQVWYGLGASRCTCRHTPPPKVFKLTTLGPSNSLLKGNLAKY